MRHVGEVAAFSGEGSVAWEVARAGGPAQSAGRRFALPPSMCLNAFAASGKKVLYRELVINLAGELGMGYWDSFSRILISGKDGTRFYIFSFFPTLKVLLLI